MLFIKQNILIKYLNKSKGKFTLCIRPNKKKESKEKICPTFFSSLQKSNADEAIFKLKLI